jgi:hypothetical protein
VSHRPQQARTRANPCFTQPTGDSPMTTARRASWRPGPDPPPPSTAPTAPSGTVTYPDARGRGTRGDRRPAGRATCSTAARAPCPMHTPVTTQAAGPHRAVRRQLDTGRTPGALLTSPPCSPHIADARIGAYGRSPLANRSASQSRRVGDLASTQLYEKVVRHSPFWHRSIG